jgi:hypothetical protein
VSSGGSPPAASSPTGPSEPEGTSSEGSEPDLTSNSLFADLPSASLLADLPSASLSAGRGLAVEGARSLSFEDAVAGRVESERMGELALLATRGLIDRCLGLLRTMRRGLTGLLTTMRRGLTAALAFSPPAPPAPTLSPPAPPAPPASILGLSIR